MDQGKRKRMISNRESARRSRTRKRDHLDDLRSQVIQLKNENREIAASVSLATLDLLPIDAENSILKAQMSELSCRLESLNEIVALLNSNNHNSVSVDCQSPPLSGVIPDYSVSDGFVNSCNLLYMNQPIMVSSADTFTY